MSCSKASLSLWGCGIVVSVVVGLGEIGLEKPIKPLVRTLGRAPVAAGEVVSAWSVGGDGVTSSVFLTWYGRMGELDSPLQFTPLVAVLTASSTLSPTSLGVVGRTSATRSGCGGGEFPCPDSEIGCEGGEMVDIGRLVKGR